MFHSPWYLNTEGLQCSKTFGSQLFQAPRLKLLKELQHVSGDSNEDGQESLLSEVPTFKLFLQVKIQGLQGNLKAWEAKHGAEGPLGLSKDSDPGHVAD
ncbi:unnamed protein product [Closterium sp. Yama58-4]|nr:unnamed protein product [Closterium sp. Yama58-4]